MLGSDLNIDILPTKKEGAEFRNRYDRHTLFYVCSSLLGPRLFGLFAKAFFQRIIFVESEDQNHG